MLINDTQTRRRGDAENETQFRREITASPRHRVTASEVLFVWNYTEWGGAQIYFLGIMRLLAAQNYKVRAVMPEGTSEKLLGYFEQENVPTSFFPARVDGQKAENSWQKLRRRWNDLKCHYVLARHLSKFGLKDKIVQIEAAPWNAASLLFFLALKTHVFVTLHISQNDQPTPRNRWIKLKYKMLSVLPTFHLLSSNEDVRNSLKWFVGEEFFETIPLAYTGVNTKEIQTILNLPVEREKLLEKYDFPKDKLLVFSLGSVIERKGFRVLIEAARRLKNENLYFVWIGDGEKREEMSDLIREFGLEKTFKNIRPFEIGENRLDLLSLLRLADVFVHPSYAEGLPGAMLEAMALGKPVVASKVNAIPEAVEYEETGLLVEAGDFIGFADAILRMAKDEHLRKSLGANAQAKVLKEFTEERCAEVTIDFYEKCLAKNRKENK